MDTELNLLEELGQLMRGGGGSEKKKFDKVAKTELPSDKLLMCTISAKKN